MKLTNGHLLLVLAQQRGLINLDEIGIPCVSILRCQGVSAGAMGAGVVFESGLFPPPEAGGGAGAQQDTNQATQQAARYEGRPYKPQFQGLEAFLAGADEEDDTTDRGGAQANVKEGVGGRALVVHAEEVVVVGASSVGGVVDLEQTAFKFLIMPNCHFSVAGCFIRGKANKRENNSRIQRSGYIPLSHKYFASN